MKVGDRFGRYEIVGTLGSGGMGAVYRALDTRLGRWVALKIVEARDDGMAQVLHEARAAAAIEHPHAVSIFDVDAVDGLPFLAMEIVDGKTLRTWIRDGDATFEDRIRWLVEVASALAAAHRRGVIHRDVKPENVIVRNDGAAKVVDFGIARALPEVDRAAVTQSMQLAKEGGPEARIAGVMTWGVRGTPAYMAPEQLRGEPLDARADQFAWGLIAFEVLTGEHAWPQRKVVDLVRCIALEEAPHAGVGPAVDAVIARTLEKRRTDRFGSMEEAAQAFSAAIEADSSASDGSRIEVQGIWFALCAAFILMIAFLPERAPASRKQVSTAGGRALSASQEALARYREGLDLLRDGSRAAAVTAFSDASTIDPEFAAAHLRAAMYAEAPDTATRTHLQRAAQARNALTDRERRFLRAYEPWTHVPADWAEAVRRWEELTRADPEDAEAWVALGHARTDVADYEKSASAFEQALSLDSKLAVAWEGKGRAHFWGGDDERARDAFARCLEISPASQTCLGFITGFVRASGRCADEEPLARRLIALEPKRISNYEKLANAQYGARGDAREARASLEEGIAKLAPLDRDSAALPADTRLSVLDGDFTRARESAHRWAENVASSPDEDAHLGPYWYQIAIAFETKQDKEASDVAREYLAKRTGWMQDEYGRLRSIHIIKMLYRVGAITRSEMVEQRAAWLTDAYERKANKAFVWIDAFAGMAVSREDADEAMALLPTVGPLPTPTNGGLDFEIDIGEAFRLAERSEDALKHLRAAAVACEAVHYPFLHVWALERWGRALEASGDPSGACRAYAEVLAAWGRAPISRTVDRVNRFSKNLHCR